jgi:hypothetical protein
LIFANRNANKKEADEENGNTKDRGKGMALYGKNEMEEGSPILWKNARLIIRLFSPFLWSGISEKSMLNGLVPVKPFYTPIIRHKNPCVFTQC